MQEQKNSIIVSDYLPKWVLLFDHFKDVFSNKFKNKIVAIHHVGSTAVPDLAAKPILDIDIEIKYKSYFDKVKIGLENLGYKHVGDLGIKEREAFKPTENLSKELPDFKHNLYVCTSNIDAFKNHIVFRDALLADKKLVAEYSQLKKDLAKKYSYNIDGYIEGKTTFILKVLSSAGFDKSVLKDIEEQNKAK